MAAEAILEASRRRKANQADSNWRDWLSQRFASYVSAGFAPRHVEFWQWVWSVERGKRPRPFVAIWPRGGAKSTSAELATVALGLRGRRRYALYVSETQEQADKHVGTIGALLEAAGVERAVNKYGASKGWRRNRLMCAMGFTVDALGLDTASRGIKVEADRPDLIVLDDVDALHDTALITQKKIDSLTQSILPTGSNDCAVLAVQNIIHPSSVFARLADGRADFLDDRIVSGPHKAIDNLGLSGREIVGGEATWDGQNLEACRGFVRSWGLHAFMRECQHHIVDEPGALWNRASIHDHRVATVPDLIRIVVGIDPPISSGDNAAEAGIVVVGVSGDGHGYVLGDYSRRGRPDEWAREAVAAYHKHKANIIAAEVNQGGEMVEYTIRTIWPQAPVSVIHASRGKHIRAEPVAAAYAEGTIHHVGSFPQLEDEQCSWVPGPGDSPNRVDALVHAANELGLGVAPVPKGTTEMLNPASHSAYVKNELAGGRWGRESRTGYRRR